MQSHAGSIIFPVQASLVLILPLYNIRFVEMEFRSSTLLLLLLWLFSCSLAVAQQQGDQQFRSLPRSDVTKLVSDLVTRGFTICAAVVQPVQSLIPSRSTLLLPTNEAIANVSSNLSQEDILRTLQYHVLNFPISFSALSRKPVGSQLSTLLPGAFLTVTSNSPGNFSINGVNVSFPDVCQNTEHVACQGIDRVLIYNASLATAPVGSPSPLGAPPESAEGVPPPPPALAPSAGSAGSSTGTRNSNTTRNNSASGVSKLDSTAVLLAVSLAAVTCLFMQSGW